LIKKPYIYHWDIVVQSVRQSLIRDTGFCQILKNIELEIPHNCKILEFWQEHKVKKIGKKILNISYQLRVKGSSWKNIHIPPFTVISNPLATNKYWQEHIFVETEQLVLGTPPILTPLGSPNYQPLPSRLASPIHKELLGDIQL
jgi:hypothetical protein